MTGFRLCHVRLCGVVSFDRSQRQTLPSFLVEPLSFPAIADRPETEVVLGIRKLDRCMISFPDYP